jgi:excisionase family DNA binding protein
MGPEVQVMKNKSSDSPNSVLAATLDAAERLVSIPWAAEFLSVSEVTVRRHLTQKRLRRYKCGGRTLVKVGDLQALIREVK